MIIKFYDVIGLGVKYIEQYLNTKYKYSKNMKYRIQILTIILGCISNITTNYLNTFKYFSYLRTHAGFTCHTASKNS